MTSGTVPKLPADIKIGDRTALGYVVAITPSMYQQANGTVIGGGPDYVELYFRSKPFSPTGKIRGVDRGTYTLAADEPFATYA